jgi:hypothetical protein
MLRSCLGDSDSTFAVVQEHSLSVFFASASGEGRHACLHLDSGDMDHIADAKGLSVADCKLLVKGALDRNDFSLCVNRERGGVTLELDLEAPFGSTRIPLVLDHTTRLGASAFGVISTLAAVVRVPLVVPGGDGRRPPKRSRPADEGDSVSAPASADAPGSQEASEAETGPSAVPSTHALKARRRPKRPNALLT